MTFKRYTFKATNTRDCRDVIARSRWEAWDVINQQKEDNLDYWDIKSWELRAIYTDVWNRDKETFFSKTALMYADVIEKMTGKDIFHWKWGEGKRTGPIWEADKPSHRSQSGQLELFDIAEYEYKPGGYRNPYQ